MKQLLFSKYFPASHTKKGEQTYFIEKIMACLADNIPGWNMLNDFTRYDWYEFYNCTKPKSHTMRAGRCWKAGDVFAPKVWSGLPYRSKTIQFASPIVVVKVWDITKTGNTFCLNEKIIETDVLKQIANNDGLAWFDFWNWFEKAGQKEIWQGQIICWNDKTNY